MMMNLFSSFDPSNSMSFSLNWLSSLMLMLYFPLMYWLIPSRSYFFFYTFIMKILVNEFKIHLNKVPSNLILMISVFVIIFLNNFMGLFSYIFTCSSHLSMSLTYSLILWISIYLFGWMKNSNKMFIHLVPQGTPIFLMPMMVVIETLSNIIRSGTLSIRLTANIVAGHLLVTLLSSTGEELSFFMLIIMLTIQSMLLILELSVSFIQAYVFSILSTLYMSEVD